MLLSYWEEVNPKREHFFKCSLCPKPARLLRVSSPREARLHGLEMEGVVDMVETSVSWSV